MHTFTVWLSLITTVVAMVFVNTDLSAENTDRPTVSLYNLHSGRRPTPGPQFTLAGRSRDQVLQEQPADYRAFRNTWTEIRQALTALLPPKGELYEGPLPAP